MPFQILAADSFPGSICIPVVISEHVQWSISSLWRQIWSLTHSCMCSYIQYRCSLSLSYSHTDSKTMKATVEFCLEFVLIIWVREKREDLLLFLPNGFQIEILGWNNSSESSEKNPVALRLYFELIDTWHAAHPSHHRRSGPNGGKLTGGFSSLTVTFAGLAAPRLRHSRLEGTHHKDIRLHRNPPKLSRNTHQWIYGLSI